MMAHATSGREGQTTTSSAACSWSLPACVLIAVIVGLSTTVQTNNLGKLLSSVGGGRAWLTRLDDDDAASTARRRGNATSLPGRLFRDYRNVARPPRDPRASAYESLWPGDHLPNWARKARGAGASAEAWPPAERRSVCFVHVGKTAGSSIG